MSAEGDFLTAMQGAGVAAIVGARVFAYIANPDTPLPLVVYERTATEPQVTIHSSVPFANKVTLSVSAWAYQRVDAENLADQVQIAMAQTGVAISRFGHFDEDVDAHATVIDFDIWDV